MSLKPKISRYPQLSEWYQKHQASPNPSDIPLSLVWSTCRALASQHQDMLRLWLQSLDTFVETSKNPKADFLEAEQLFQSAGLDYLELACEIAEFGIELNEGSTLFDLFEELAESTDLTVFRFLCAWTAFNTGMPKICIDQCELIDEPFACVYTLQGQALLESGDALGAIESLSIAVQLSADESLAFFQLAKAYFALDRYEEAWKQLEHCDRLLPQHAEVEGLQSLVALHAKGLPQRAEWLRLCRDKLLNQAKQENRNIQILLLAHDVIFELEEENALQDLYATIDWGFMKSQPEFLRTVPQLLRSFEKYGWRKQATAFLDFVVA